jgi:hypothetical protein
MELRLPVRGHHDRRELGQLLRKLRRQPADAPDGGREPRDVEVRDLLERLRALRSQLRPAHAAPHPPAEAGPHQGVHGRDARQPVRRGEEPFEAGTSRGVVDGGGVEEDQSGRDLGMLDRRQHRHGTTEALAGSSPAWPREATG